MNLIGPARQREGLSSSGPVEVGRPVPCQGTEGSCVQPQRPTPESDFSEMSRDQFFPFLQLSRPLCFPKRSYLCRARRANSLIVCAI